MATPRYDFEFDGLTYTLIGTFGLIEKIEYAMKESIVSVAMRVTDMQVSEIAKLLSIVISSTGVQKSSADIGDVLWNKIGITGEQYTIVCLNLYAFLRITIAKPSDRAEVKQVMGELLAKWNKAANSLGSITNSSV